MSKNAHDGQTEPSRCALCGQPLTGREREVCLAAPERFAGQLLCFAHQKRFNACSAVRWPPGR